MGCRRAWRCGNGGGEWGLGWIGAVGEVAVGEGPEEELGVAAAAWGKEPGVAAGLVEPGGRQGTELGVNLGTHVVDREGVAAAADEGAVGTEAFGLGVAAAKETVLEAVALEAGGELLASLGMRPEGGRSRTRQPLSLGGAPKRFSQAIT